MTSEYRILVVDDNEDIHDDYLKALDLYAQRPEKRKLRDLEALLFRREDLPPEKPLGPAFRITSAFQGEEAYELAVKANMDGEPFAVAFVDVRMPPGIDGIQTTRRLLSDVPSLEIVLCSAYSDYPWERINEILGETERVLFLRKPFDVIEVKQMTQALCRKWYLRRQNQQATRELMEAKENALAASREKSSFLSNMSHEIRTPLNGVVGMAGLLRQTNLDKEQKEYVSAISYSAQILMDLINNILDFSRIEAGKLSLEETHFNLHELITDLRTLFGHSMESRGLNLAIKIDPSVPKFVNGDPTRIRQILINFLSNAMKFTEKGGIAVKVIQMAGGDEEMTLRIDVTDTGIGISEEGKEKLFQTFGQIDASYTRKYGGSGLGLVISKMLARLLSGTVGMESKRGEGSTFWFTCKVRHASEIPPLEAWADPILEGAHVLILNHNELLSEQLTHLLGAWHCRYEFVHTVEEAVSLLQKNLADDPFKLALVEWASPKLDEDAFTTTLQDSGLGNLPRVLLTLKDLPENDRTIQPCETVVSLPIDEHELHDCLRDILLREAHPLNEKAPIILVAEDNKVNRKVVNHMLKKAGYRTRVVENGKEAVAAHTRDRYDLIIMDCQMPEMDGYEATRKIRATEHGPQYTPVLALTASTVMGDREKCLEAGMDDYITKPIAQDDLLKHIRLLLRERSEKGRDESNI